MKLCEYPKLWEQGKCEECKVHKANMKKKRFLERCVKVYKEIVIEDEK